MFTTSNSLGHKERALGFGVPPLSRRRRQVKKKLSRGGTDGEASKERKKEGYSLFKMPEWGKTGIEPKHVR